MLRVCLVTGEYPPDEGGVADYTRCLAYALAAEHVAVDVVTTRRRRDALGDALGHALGDTSGRAPGQRRDDPAEIDPLRRWVNVHRVVTPGWGWAALPALRRAVGVLGPDVLHVQYQAAAYALRGPVHLAPWWARRGRRARVAVTFHDLREPYLFPRAGRLRRRAVVSLAKLADRAVTTNADDFASLAAELPAERVTLIPIGSNVPDDPPAAYDRDVFRSNAGISPGTGLIAYFGFLNESKGALALAEALALLAKAGRDVRLAMIGGAVGASDPTNAAGLSRFEARIDELGLGEAVRWTGHLPPAGVSAWLHAADVAALPYRDGASYRRGSLLAALAHGVPIVTTEGREGSASAGGSTPPLDQGVSALLVPPDDPAALAEAIGRVLDDRALAGRLARGARDVSASFTWPAIAAGHVEMYRELTEGTVS